MKVSGFFVSSNSSDDETLIKCLVCVFTLCMIHIPTLNTRINWLVIFFCCCCCCCVFFGSVYSIVFDTQTRQIVMLIPFRFIHFQQAMPVWTNPAVSLCTYVYVCQNLNDDIETKWSIRFLFVFLFIGILNFSWANIWFFYLLNFFLNCLILQELNELKAKHENLHIFPLGKYFLKSITVNFDVIFFFRCHELWKFRCIGE